MHQNKTFILAFMFFTGSILLSACSKAEPEVENIAVKAAKTELKTAEFNVTGMTCEGCASTIDQTLSNIYGVENSEVSLEKEYAVVTYNAVITDIEAMKKAVKKAGYELSEAKKEAETTE